MNKDIYVKYIPCNLTLKQMEFFDSNEMQVFFGGAGGGRKSFSLLAAAMKYIELKDYHAVIFVAPHNFHTRYSGLLCSMVEWLVQNPLVIVERYSKCYIYYFPSGAVLEIRSLKTMDDVYMCAGAEYQFVGMDDFENYSQLMYRYMFSRLRQLHNKEDAIPLRMRTTGLVKPIFVDGYGLVKPEGVEGDQVRDISCGPKDVPYLKGDD